MNKKITIIIGILFLIAIVTLSCIFIKNNTSLQGKTSENEGNSIKIKDYTWTFNSQNEGSTSGNSYYTIPFEIVDEENERSTYEVDFINLILKSEGKNEEVVYDIEAPEVTIINSKKFYYYINDYGLTATLYYQLPDEAGLLEIEVTGRKVFNAEGEQLKMRATVNKDVIESPELAKVLDFYVSK